MTELKISGYVYDQKDINKLKSFKKIPYGCKKYFNIYIISDLLNPCENYKFYMISHFINKHSIPLTSKTMIVESIQM